MTKWEEFNMYWKYYLDNGLRNGQSIFNAVRDVDDELAELIRASEHDCCYHDNKMDMVIAMFKEKHKC